MRKIVVTAILTLGIFFSSADVCARPQWHLVDILTNETLTAVLSGEWISFESWNHPVVSFTEKDINEIFLDQMADTILAGNPSLLPKKISIRSTAINLDEESLELAIRYGKVGIPCKLKLAINTDDTSRLSIGNAKLRIFNIPMPAFITRWLLKGDIAYEVCYKELFGKDSIVQVEGFRLDKEKKLLKVKLSISEEKLIETIHPFFADEVWLLKNKTLADYTDLSQLQDMHLYICEDTVNRIFNEQLYQYLQSEDSIIPEGFFINHVSVLLQEGLLNADIQYMGFQLNVQTEFTPYCQDNIIGIRLGEMYLEGQQLPPALKKILEQFTKDIRFDVAAAGIPPFIKVKGLDMGNELDLNISIDVLNKKPVGKKQLEVLLGPGIADETAYFEYFAPVTSLSESINKLMTKELLQAALHNNLRSPIFPGCSYVFADLIKLNDFSIDMEKREVILTAVVWNTPITLSGKFSLESGDRHASLVFSHIAVRVEEQCIPDHVISQVTQNGVRFMSEFNDIARFIYMEELSINKLALDDMGLVIRFAIE